MDREHIPDEVKRFVLASIPSVQEQRGQRYLRQVVEVGEIEPAFGDMPEQVALTTSGRTAWQCKSTQRPAPYQWKQIKKRSSIGKTPDAASSEWPA